MTNLESSLRRMVDGWESLGHPALLERFVLRNGRAFTPRKRIGRRRKARHCFQNSTHFISEQDGEYVEGYVDCIIPIHHAWVTINGTDAMDLTLKDTEDREYFGVVFSREVLWEEMLKTGHYGILDTTRGLNIDLMFKVDPELKTICETIRKGRANVVKSPARSR